MKTLAIEQPIPQRQGYDSNLTDQEWVHIEPMLPRRLTYKYNYREILDAIFYLVKTGCQWRNLPHDLP